MSNTAAKPEYLKFDRKRCAVRSRLAAKRDGVDAVNVRFMSEPAPVLDERRLLSSYGTLPDSHEQELALINSLRPEEGKPLTAANVFIHYLEAANDTFIEDRHLFLDRSTLKNIAEDARRGVAFMNSHRTGGLSAPSELPFGRTFSGRYEEYTDEASSARQRALVGMYMLRGVHPNGRNGPSTDDLSAAINGGTLFDVSVALRGGERLCDVCGYELDAWDYEKEEYLCPHAPGTYRKMTDEHKEAQKARGVPGGKASYRLTNARMGEVSGVYDGAVPGAGFQKTLALARIGALSQAEMGEARHAYQTLLSRGDLNMDGISEAIERGFASVLSRLGIRGREDDDAEFAPTAGTSVPSLPPPAAGLPSPPPAALAGEQTPSQAEMNKRILDDNANLRRTLFKTEAEAWVQSLIHGDLIAPNERSGILAFYAALAEDEGAATRVVSFGADPLGGKAGEGNRLEAFKALYERRPKQMLLGEVNPGEYQALFNNSNSGDEKPMTAERRNELLRHTPLGQRILDGEKGGR